MGAGGRVCSGAGSGAGRYKTYCEIHPSLGWASETRSTINLPTRTKHTATVTELSF